MTARHPVLPPDRRRPGGGGHRLLAARALPRHGAAGRASADRIDQPLRRIWGFLVYVIGQKRLLQDPVPGLMHAFIFWGFVALLVTTGNYITNGLVETVLAWPLNGVLWMLAVGLANLFIGLVLVGVGYSLVWRRIVVRPTRLALSRDAFVILALILAVVITELVGDALRFVAHPDDPGTTLAFLAGPLSGVLAPIGPDAAAGLVRPVRLAAHRLRAGLRRVPAIQQAPAHPDQRAERLLPQPGAARRAAQDGPGGGATARRGAGLRRQGAQGPVLAAPARRPVLHRVRPLHGVLPGQPDRQDAQPQALHGGAARPDRDGRDGPGGRGFRPARGEGRGERRRGGLGRGTRPGPRASGRRAVAAAGRQRHPGGGGLAVHHLRLVRGGLPGPDRARRLDRRDPPQPGAGGVVASRRS